MKKFILLIIVLILSTDFSHSNPPDNCLWAPSVAFLGPVIYPDAFDNSDSTVFLDTCGLWEIDPTVYFDSVGNYTGKPSSFYAQFYEKSRRYYSKSRWDIDIISLPGIQIFDTLGKDLNSMEYFTVDDIDSNYKEIYEGFKQTKQKYGEIKIRLFPHRSISINEQLMKLSTPLFYLILETENIVNSIEFAEFIEDVTHHICTFRSGFVYNTSISEKSNINIQISIDNEILYLTTEEPVINLEIYSVQGIKILDKSPESYGKKEMNIEINKFPSGIYFIKINNSIIKFSITR